MTSYGKWSYSTLEMRVLLTHLGMKQLFPNSSCPFFIYEVILLTGHFSISFFIYSLKNFRCLWRGNCLFLVFTRTVKFFIKSERILRFCFFLCCFLKEENSVYFWWNKMSHCQIVRVLIFFRYASMHSNEESQSRFQSFNLAECFACCQMISSI